MCTENFIFVNNIKRHLCNVKNLLLGHDLPISVNDRVILPFREDFIFTKLRMHMRSFAKIKPWQKFRNLQYGCIEDADETYVYALTPELQ